MQLLRNCFHFFSPAHVDMKFCVDMKRSCRNKNIRKSDFLCQREEMIGWLNQYGPTNRGYWRHGQYTNHNENQGTLSTKSQISSFAGTGLRPKPNW